MPRLERVRTFPPGLLRSHCSWLKLDTVKSTEVSFQRDTNELERNLGEYYQRMSDAVDCGAMKEEMESWRRWRRE
jgi:hypothetical protein